MTRLGRLALALAALAAAFAGAAHAADSAQTAPSVLEGGGALFPDRAYVLTFPSKRQLSTSDVTVTEDGNAVKGVVVQPAASGTGIGTVLLIDSSNSMKGSIDEAMKAARAFAAKNPGQPLSVVFFDRVPRVALGFTTDTKQVNAVLAKAPPLHEGTRIYDALSAATAQVRGSGLGAASIVLLTDGADVGSVTSPDSALSQLQDQKIRVYSVGIKSPDFEPAPLEKLAAGTGGAFAEATSPQQLSALYEALGFKLGNEYLLRYRSGARPNEKVDVKITVAGLQAPLTLSYTTPATGTAAPYSKPFVDRIMQSWLLTLAVIAGVAGLVFYAVVRLLSLRSNRRLRRRLGEFVTLPEEEQAAERRKEVDELLAAVGTEKNKRELRFLTGFAEDCDVAQITREPKRLFWTSVVVGVAIGVVLGAIIQPFWLLIGFVPPLAVNGWVRHKARKTRDAFAEQLPEGLDVLASALRAGHSLAGATAVMADEAPEPSRREFKRVVADEQLGIPLDEAFEVTAKRMQSTDMEQVAMLALLQREAGGNTAEVLDQVIRNIRARMDLRRLVTVLTAQGRFSSWIIAAVPIGILVFILLVNPQQLDPLWHDPIGQVSVVLSVIGVILGFYIIRKIVSIEL